VEQLLDLLTIEGPFSPHDRYLRHQLDRRKACLAPGEPEPLAEFIGGRVEEPRSDEKWCISKEVFPGVRIHIMFRCDEEFGDRLEALFSGERIRSMPGEDLAELALATVNHMVRHVRSRVPVDRLPEICRRM
jgi:hypothetical protein